jgi:hypothetical protein
MTVKKVIEALHVIAVDSAKAQIGGRIINRIVRIGNILRAF